MAIIEVIQQNPKISIIAIAFVISLFITIINYFFLNKERMREIKARQKAIQAEMKQHKDNPKKLSELNQELFSHMGESMKHSLKPMLITLIPILFIFASMRGIFAETALAKSWIWYYIGSSILFSIILRKVFKLP